MESQPEDDYKELLYIRRRFLSHRWPTPGHSPGGERHACRADAPDLGRGHNRLRLGFQAIRGMDQNLLTEWHLRYGGRGVMVYWHVEKNAICIYSQFKRVSSSEAAAMIEGVLRHCTEMEVNRQYVDSHGQSTVAFAFCRLLGFELMPRLKGISLQKLYKAKAGQTFSNLDMVRASPVINWELIEEQLDIMVKHAAALKLGMADAESLLRRFARNNAQHPAYKALSELASNKRENQEIGLLCLHLLQASLVYVNTLMIQQVIGDPKWFERMTTRDLAALSPLLTQHINPYGRLELDMETRLLLDR